MKRGLRITTADQTIWALTTSSDAPCRTLGSPGRGRPPTTLPWHFQGPPATQAEVAAGFKAQVWLGAASVAAGGWPGAGKMK